MSGFKLQSSYVPAGDQPQAIEQLVSGIEKDMKHQVLLGITGSGKTFTMANVIQKVQKFLVYQIKIQVHHLPVIFYVFDILFYMIFPVVFYNPHLKLAWQQKY